MAILWLVIFASFNLGKCLTASLIVSSAAKMTLFLFFLTFCYFLGKTFKSCTWFKLETTFKGSITFSLFASSQTILYFCFCFCCCCRLSRSIVSRCRSYLGPIYNMIWSNSINVELFKMCLTRLNSTLINTVLFKMVSSLLVLTNSIFNSTTITTITHWHLFLGYVLVTRLL